MSPIRYVPVVPFPKIRVSVHMNYGYDLKAELPYVLEITEAEWQAGFIDTVWGVTGMACKDVLILPAALYPNEALARSALNQLIVKKQAL